MDNDRFLGKKVTDKTISEISKTNEMEDAQEREAIYEAKRPEIQYKFRYNIVKLSMTSVISTFSFSSEPPLRASPSSAMGFSRIHFTLPISSRT